MLYRSDSRLRTRFGIRFETRLPEVIRVDVRPPFKALAGLSSKTITSILEHPLLGGVWGELTYSPGLVRSLPRELRNVVRLDASNLLQLPSHRENASSGRSCSAGWPDKSRLKLDREKREYPQVAEQSLSLTARSHFQPKLDLKLPNLSPSFLLRSPFGCGTALIPALFSTPNIERRTPNFQVTL